MMNIFTRKSRIKWAAYKNPDGTKGGMIAEGSIIDEGVYIPVSSVVMPGVHVTHDTKITDGDLLTSNGAVRFTP